jgi:protoporphyrin/coproporphyrin ferrochelatase
MEYDALLIVSFGGPEKPEDVMPFLENVTRGRRIPRERLEEVAEHYYHFGGKSPINEQVAALIDALRAELATHGPNLPIYLGNRNWQPYLADTMRQMKADGVKRALAFITSAWSSYSSCRQYLDNIAAAHAAVGDGAPEIDRLRLFYNHPGFIETMAERVRDAYATLPEALRDNAPLLFTAHSIPMSMSENCRYVSQLTEACGLVAQLAGRDSWRLVYQSRSGPPTKPWLEPDILDTLKEHAASGGTGVVVAPIGFLSDHMEVMYDLDHEAKHLCDELGLTMARAGTVGHHPRFVTMIRELITERTHNIERKALGARGPMPDVCFIGCCPAPMMPQAAGGSHISPGRG